MTRQDDMLTRYGEVVTITQAGHILNRCNSTIKNMAADGRLRKACGGTMIDVRSIADYIEAPAQMEEKARMTRTGRKWMV